MPTNSNQNHSNQDEIDLLSLIVKSGKLIKKAVQWLINSIGSILVYILRKWYYLATALVLTVITALILKTLTPSYYSSDLIMRSNAINNQPIMMSIDKLGDYASAGNYSALSTELNLSLKEASAIKELKTFWYYDIGDDGIFDGIVTDEAILIDTGIAKIDSVFIIRAEVFDPMILEKIEGSLVDYLGSIPFLEALNNQRLSDLEARLIQTTYEIKKLDSLQTREYYTNTDDLRQKEGQIIFTSENENQKLYHYEMFKLLQLKQECERDLNVYRDVVTIMQDFTIPVEPENGTVLYAKKTIWYFLGLALLLSFIVSYRKKIWVR
jgi:hypothetical protein